ncbi:unnamed protein product [Polarella glacialis]|uniref:Pentatricopeptide repeat-containing protein, chloroplastic n=1 Tax=Polarella glacialis TaxID=89957 RepID=A0A813G697_POLGL|nr:unnamed protein product [Polarella glacialis]
MGKTLAPSARALSAVDPLLLQLTRDIAQSGRQRQWEHALLLLHRASQQGAIPLDEVVFGATVTACEQARQWVRAYALLDEMQAKQISPNTVCFNAAIAACSLPSGAHAGRAIDLLQEMSAASVPPDVASYNSTMRSCGKRWALVLSVLRQMRRNRLRPDGVSRTAAVGACEKASQWNWSLWLLTEFPWGPGGKLVPGYNAAISACSRSHRWPQALSLLVEMKRQSAEPDEVSLTSCLSALERAGRWMRALVMLTQLRGWLARRGSSAPDAIAFGSGISACKKGAQWGLALSFLFEARWLGLDLGPEGLGAALRACARGAEWRRALQLADSASPGASFATSGGGLGALGCTFAADACARAGRPELAPRLLQKVARPWAAKGLDGAGPPLGECARAIGFFAMFALVPPKALALRLNRAALGPVLRLRDVPPSRSLWQGSSDLGEVCEFGPSVARSWMERGVRSTTPRVQTLGQVSDDGKLDVKESWAAAVEALSAAWRHGWRCDTVTCNKAIATLGVSGRWQQGLRMVKELRSRDVRPDTVTFNSLAGACCGNRWWLALGAVLEMQHLGLELDCFTFGTLITACGRNSYWTRALTLIFEMRLGGLQACNAAISACGKGSWPQALWLLEIARCWGAGLTAVGYSAAVAAVGSGAGGGNGQHEGTQAAALGRRAELTASAFNAALTSCERASIPAAALRLFQTGFSSARIAPDLTSFGAVAAACARGGLWQAALDLCGEAKIRQMMCGSVLRACGSEWEQAMALLRDMKRRGVEMDSMNCEAALSVCRTAERWASCLDLISQARLSGLSPGTAGISTAMDACARSSLWEEVFQLLRPLAACRLQADLVCLNVALASCRQGPVQFSEPWIRACAILDKMQRLGPSPDIISYNAAISSCHACMQPVPAIRLLSGMRHQALQPDAISFNTAVSACERGDRWRSALMLLAKSKADGLAPDIVRCNAAVSACEKCRKWQTALELLCDIVHGALQLDAISLASTVTACAGSRQWSQASWLLSKVRILGMKVDVAAYHQAAFASEQVDEWRQALAVLSDMRATAVQLDQLSFTTALAALGRGAFRAKPQALLQDLGKVVLRLGKQQQPQPQQPQQQQQ